MGLIRSNNTNLTPLSPDEALTRYLWPIVKEMIKTAIENNQNLIVEGCYIPFCWRKDFSEEYIKNIRFYCLIMSKNYISNHFKDIKKYASIIENRLEDDLEIENVLEDNREFLKLCEKWNENYILIDDEYKVDIEL